MNNLNVQELEEKANVKLELVVEEIKNLPPEEQPDPTQIKIIIDRYDPYTGDKLKPEESIVEKHELLKQKQELIRQLAAVQSNINNLNYLLSKFDNPEENTTPEKPVKE